MFNMILENEANLQLTFGMNSPYTISEFQGLEPASATINTSQAALIDGQKFNSSKLQMRTIELAFAIEENVEENRLNVYRVIRPKKPIRLYYQSEYLDLFIDGYVQDIKVPYFDKKQIVTVEILCPSPYFKSAQQIINELSSIINGFYFPFASTEEPEIIFGIIDNAANIIVPNNGNIECGLTFELYAKDSISNPKIFNYLTGDFIGINFTMDAGDTVVITTGQGNKTITLIRDAVETNIFNTLMKNSTWLQLELNGSVFVYQVETGILSNLVVTIKHYELYEGV